MSELEHGRSIMQEMLSLAAKHARRDIETLSPETRLRRDLGLSGDAARAFMEAVAVRYNINWDGFHWRHYFGEEGLGPLFEWVLACRMAASRDFRQRWRAAQACDREITLAHLANVASTRKWAHPEEQLIDAGSSDAGQGALRAILAMAAAPHVLATLALGSISIYSVASAGSTATFDATGPFAMASMMGLVIWVEWTNADRVIARKLAATSTSQRD